MQMGYLSGITGWTAADKTALSGGAAVIRFHGIAYPVLLGE